MTKYARIMFSYNTTRGKWNPASSYAFASHFGIGSVWRWERGGQGVGARGRRDRGDGALRVHVRVGPGAPFIYTAVDTRTRKKVSGSINFFPNCIQAIVLDSLRLPLHPIEQRKIAVNTRPHKQHLRKKTLGGKMSTSKP